MEVFVTTMYRYEAATKPNTQSPRQNAKYRFLRKHAYLYMS